MITEESIEKALDWLRNNAEAAAQARANVLYLEEYRKSKKALLMAQSDAKTVSERETYAYGHEDYLTLLEGYKAAVEADTKFRWLQSAAEARIDAWRTLNANHRIQARVG